MDTVRNILTALLLLTAPAWAQRYAIATRSNATDASDAILESDLPGAKLWVTFNRPPSDFPSWQVVDYSTNYFTITNTSPNFIAGWSGQAQRFTGGSYARIPSGSISCGTNDFTLLLTFRPDYATSAAGTTIIGCANENGSNALFSVATIATMTPRVFMRDAAGTSLIMTHTTALESGKWYNVYFSRQATSHTFGVAYSTNNNFVLVVSNAAPINIIGTNYSFGANFRTGPDTVNTPTTGAIDRCALFGPTISAADISNFFSKGYGASAP